MTINNKAWRDFGWCRYEITGTTRSAKATVKPDNDVGFGRVETWRVRYLTVNT